MNIKYFFIVLTLMVALKGYAAVPDTVNIENPNVYRYINENTYTDIKQTTAINKYLNEDKSVRLDLPNLVKVELPSPAKANGKFYFSTSSDFSNATIVDIKKGDTECIIKNPVPGTTVYSKAVINGSVVIKGKTYIDGKVRMIYTPSIKNVRDMGGWNTQSGKKVQYGLVFRGGELDEMHVADQEDLDELRRLGIGADLDLRNWDETQQNGSVIGDDIAYLFKGHAKYTWLALRDDVALWKEDFEFVVNNLRKGKAVYIHCIYGADRTGVICLLAGGLLGMDIDAIVKDYELTSMSGSKRDISFIKDHINYVRNFKTQKALETETETETIAEINDYDCFYDYFRQELNVSAKDIRDFRKIMLDGYKAYAETTNIETFDSDCSNDADSYFYDLSSRRVNNPSRGLYIKGGKKIYIK